jgi:hypothetical protein
MVAVFTIYFEDPFWVGVLESEDFDTLTVARHVFGSEPSNAELLQFMLYRFSSMPRQTAAISRTEARLGEKARAGASAAVHTNPKRALREARREVARPPSTKAQAALSAALEDGKVEQRTLSREESLALDARRFELRSEKRKKKRAGH